ncbi:MAG: hypothetical protein KDA69_13490 [Planctomycetaceae bacterium]|nr:hypothetical protein [Planctomycetaceae bacterium]
MPLKIEQTQEWRSNDIVFGLARVPNSERFLIGSSDFGVYELDVSVEKPERVEFTGDRHLSYVTSLALVGQTLVSASYDGRLIFWDISERKTIRAIEAHDRWIRKLASVPGTDIVLSVADDMQCKAWNVTTGELVKQFTDHAPFTPNHFPSMLYTVAVSADGKLAATGDKVGHVAIWNLETFEQVGQVETPILYTWDPRARVHSIGGIRSVAFSQDGTQLAVGGIGTIGNVDHLDGPSHLEIFDWQSQKQLHNLEDSEKKGLIEQIQFHPEHKWVAIAGGDHKGFIKFYDPTSGELLASGDNGGHVHAMHIAEDWSVIDTVCHNRVSRWQVSVDG